MTTSTAVLGAAMSLLVSGVAGDSAGYRRATNVALELAGEAADIFPPTTTSLNREDATKRNELQEEVRVGDAIPLNHLALKAKTIKALLVESTFLQYCDPKYFAQASTLLTQVQAATSVFSSWPKEIRATSPEWSLIAVAIEPGLGSSYSLPRRLPNVEKWLSTDELRGNKRVAKVLIAWATLLHESARLGLVAVKPTDPVKEARDIETEFKKLEGTEDAPKSWSGEKAAFPRVLWGDSPLYIAVRHERVGDHVAGATFFVAGVNAEAIGAARELCSLSAKFLATKSGLESALGAGVTRMHWKSARAQFYFMLLTTMAVAGGWALASFRKKKWIAGIAHTVMAAMVLSYEPVIYVVSELLTFDRWTIESGTANVVSTGVIVGTFLLYTCYGAVYRRLLPSLKTAGTNEERDHQGSDSH